jgi:hypothetical protein
MRCCRAAAWRAALLAVALVVAVALFGVARVKVLVAATAAAAARGETLRPTSKLALRLPVAAGTWSPQAALVEGTAGRMSSAEVLCTFAEPRQVADASGPGTHTVWAVNVDRQAATRVAPALTRDALARAEAALPALCVWSSLCIDPAHGVHTLAPTANQSTTTTTRAAAAAAAAAKLDGLTPWAAPAWRPPTVLLSSTPEATTLWRTDTCTLYVQRVTRAESLPHFLYTVALPAIAVRLAQGATTTTTTTCAVWAVEGLVPRRAVPFAWLGFTHVLPLARALPLPPTPPRRCDTWAGLCTDEDASDSADSSLLLPLAWPLAAAEGTPGSAAPVCFARAVVGTGATVVRTADGRAERIHPPRAVFAEARRLALAHVAAAVRDGVLPPLAHRDHQHDNHGAAAAVTAPAPVVLVLDGPDPRRLLNAAALVATLEEAGVRAQLLWVDDGRGGRPADDDDGGGGGGEAEIGGWDARAWAHTLRAVAAATVVVAAHGPAASHALWLPAGGTLIEVFPLGVHDPFYARAMQAQGVWYAAWHCGDAWCDVANSLARGLAVVAHLPKLVQLVHTALARAAAGAVPPVPSPSVPPSPPSPAL